MLFCNFSEARHVVLGAGAGRSAPWVASRQTCASRPTHLQTSVMMLDTWRSLYPKTKIKVIKDL